MCQPAGNTCNVLAVSRPHLVPHPHSLLPPWAARLDLTDLGCHLVYAVWGLYLVTVLMEIGIQLNWHLKPMITNKKLYTWAAVGAIDTIQSGRKHL